MLNALFGRRPQAPQGPQRAKPDPWSSSAILNDSLKTTTQPTGGGGHSMSGGDIQWGSTPIGGSDTLGPLTTSMGGGVQWADSVPHHVGGQVLGAELSHGGASAYGSYLNGEAGISRTEGMGGRKTTGIGAQANIGSAGLRYENEDVMGHFGMSLGSGFGARVHSGGKFGLGADIGPFSGDLAFSTAAMSRFQPDLNHFDDHF
jgi:hypothetical protein